MTERKYNWLECGKNMLISIGVFGVLLLLLYFTDKIFPSLTMLRWSDAAWCVGIPASIVGVAYVLTIRNPKNYTGFVAGIVMSVLLAVQFFLQGNYDLTVLYTVVFVPMQTLSIVRWKKQSNAEDESAVQPSYLNKSQLVWSLIVFVAIIVVDYLLVTLVINKDTFSDAVLIKIFGGLMIASSILANYWLIYKKTDAWFYWIVYSMAGIAFYVFVNNPFSIVLFCFFLVVNSMAAREWIRNK